jgi:hypothetical protein
VVFRAIILVLDAVGSDLVAESTRLTRKPLSRKANGAHRARQLNTCAIEKVRPTRRSGLHLASFAVLCRVCLPLCRTRHYLRVRAWCCYFLEPEWYGNACSGAPDAEELGTTGSWLRVGRPGRAVEPRIAFTRTQRRAQSSGVTECAGGALETTASYTVMSLRAKVLTNKHPCRVSTLEAEVSSHAENTIAEEFRCATPCWSGRSRGAECTIITIVITLAGQCCFATIETFRTLISCPFKAPTSAWANFTTCLCEWRTPTGAEIPGRYCCWSIKSARTNSPVASETRHTRMA